MRTRAIPIARQALVTALADKQRLYDRNAEEIEKRTTQRNTLGDEIAFTEVEQIELSADISEIEAEIATLTAELGRG